MTIASQLQEIIDSVARTGALTPDAIRQFDEYRRKAEELENTLELRKKERDEARSTRDKLVSDLGEVKTQLVAATKRAEAAESRNVQADRALWIAEFEKERRIDMRSILSDVFRNAEIQKYITQTNPIVLPPQYSGASPTVQLNTDTRTESETRK